MSKYLDYTDNFSFNFIIKQLKNIIINKYIIKLVKDKLLFYRLIYSLRLVKLETLKTYIKIYLKTRFIQLFKSLINISIFFDQKSDKSLCFCINY